MTNFRNQCDLEFSRSLSIGLVCVEETYTCSLPRPAPESIQISYFGLKWYSYLIHLFMEHLVDNFK